MTEAFPDSNPWGREAHDDLCQASLNENDDIYFCICEFIAKVRADERAAIMSRVKQDMTVDREKWTVLAGSTWRADLRDKVETLRDQWRRKEDLVGDIVVAELNEVLDLFDGSSDE